MIFKYCIWPSVATKEDKKVTIDNYDNGNIMKNIFHWCPVFRRKKSLDSELNLETASFNRINIPRLITTPVIPIRHNQSVSSMYEFIFFSTLKSTPTNKYTKKRKKKRKRGEIQKQ